MEDASKISNKMNLTKMINRTVVANIFFTRS